ncbi:MAG: histidine phosphatase family protein [Bacteriovoracaceae bacterium]|nr:histidine phosphatase family protein [Bacteriovoracaceae bacterium]
MDFYLFRHGQTDWNFEKKCQGSTDIPLNDTGRNQAVGLADFMENIPLEIIFTSHLKRAHETAQIVSSAKKVPLEINKDLRETFFGEMEGLFLDDIVKHVGEEYWNQFRDVLNKDRGLCLPGGETRGEVTDRMSAVLETLIDQNQYQSIGISTHGSALVNLLKIYWEEGRVFPKVGNCSLFHLKYEKEKGFIPVGFLKED